MVTQDWLLGFPLFLEINLALDLVVEFLQKVLRHEKASRKTNMAQHDPGEIELNWESGRPHTGCKTLDKMSTGFLL